MKGPLSQLGRYHILEKIASGGMASVYRARMEGPEGASRIVAVKILHPHLAEDEEHVAMFRDEGRLSTRLSHPNLVPAFDHGVIEGYHFIAMELLSCVSLSALTDHLELADRVMELPDAVWVLSEVLAGLAYSHALSDERGQPLSVVHRDVSPQNVLITTDGQVKVIDFGIARGRNRSVYSRVGVVKGKAGYMSPEQAAGHPDLDARTDVYAAAVVGYELLTGRALFGDGDTDRIRRRIVNAPDPALPADADLPLPLSDALAKALRRSPDDRFADAVAFRTALEAFLAEKRHRPDRKAIAALAREALDEREKNRRKERKEGAGRKAEPKKKPAAKPALPTASAKPATEAPRAIAVRADNDDATIRWMARVALLVLVMGLLMEIFGVALPTP